MEMRAKIYIKIILIAITLACFSQCKYLPGVYMGPEIERLRIIPARENCKIEAHLHANRLKSNEIDSQIYTLHFWYEELNSQDYDYQIKEVEICTNKEILGAYFDTTAISTDSQELIRDLHYVVNDSVQVIDLTLRSFNGEICKFKIERPK